MEECEAKKSMSLANEMLNDICRSNKRKDIIIILLIISLLVEPVIIFQFFTTPTTQSSTEITSSGYGANSNMVGGNGDISNGKK